MECNKEEAMRAKAIAEGKLAEKDFAGAQKFLLKARNLFPELEGVSQILTILEVYIASENKVNGEVDWYGVLGVNPSADDEAIRKQYRRLALILHPDKNKSVGADGAFKLLSEAWSLLSDKPKRLAYNQRRFSRGIQHNKTMKSGAPQAPPNANGFHKFSKRAMSSSNIAKSTNRVQVSSARSHHRTDTFWTICHRCQMHYEYLRVYLNHTLLCPNCHKAFLASETSPPVSILNQPSSSSQQNHQHLGHHVPNGYSVNPGSGSASSNFANSTQPPSNRTMGLGNTATVEKLKRERMDAQGSFGGWEGFLKKRRELNDNGNGLYGSFGTHHKPNNVRDFMQLDIRSLLMEKACTEIRKKVDEWHLEDIAKVAETKKDKEKAKEKDKSSLYNTFGVYGNGVPSTTHKTNKEISEPVVMTVPDPDFHDFDRDRTESSFQEDQVWAAYDDDDGMPRIYAMIHKVKSLDPFQMEISWLNSKTNTEFGPLDWVVLGFRKTCGDFRSGKHEINRCLNSFSHRVNWAKGPRGNVCIYPKRGDVWALYRNWAPDWNEHTPDEIIHKYDMVEVLEGYNEHQGVYIAPLVKVSGFKTVFQTQMDPDKVRRIPKEEMFRFSHQVPNYILTGFEGQNAPKGCSELDPAAIPLELLQVVKEDRGAIMEGNKGKAVSVNSENRVGEERKRGETILKYSRKQQHS